MQLRPEQLGSDAVAPFGETLLKRSPLLLVKDLPNHTDNHVSPVASIGWEQRSEFGYLGVCQARAVERARPSSATAG